MQHKMKSLFTRTLHGLPLVLTAILLSVIMYSLIEPGNPLAALGADAFFAPNAVTISATKTDALFNDVDGDFNADPGDTLQYTIVVANSGDTDATNTLLTDPTDDTELTVVAGSLRATPIGRNDTYSVLGNTHITHPVGTGVLANDLDPDGGTFTADSCLTCTTANNGTITLNFDGSFTYSPPAGFTGTDTFNYTVTDNHGLTDTGTVTFNVTNRIWWVDSNAAGAGTGTSLDPFKTLPSAQTASLINDTIFVYERGTAYTGGMTLKDGQKFCGHGASLVACSGLIAPTGTTFPAVSTNPTITNAAGNGVTLAQNNTIHGLTLGNTGATANYALIGTNFGTLNLQNVTINTNNGAISLNTGTPAASFTSVTSTGGTNNVALTSVNGTLIITTGAVSGATSDAVLVNGGTATLSFGFSIANSTAKAVNIQNKTGGTVSFSAAINSTGTGITLNNNPGTTLTFNGSLTLTTGTNTAFSATNSGTLNIFIGTNTINTTTGTAVNIVNTTIGSSGVTFRSISSNGGANPGIILNNTGTTGSFTVSGTGSAGTGGTIQNKTGDAIQFTTVDGVSLNYMTLTGIGGNGILGNSVTDFAMANSTFTNIADTFTPDEAALFFNNLQGLSSFTNNTITNAFDDQIIVYQTGVANLTLFTLSGNTFNGHDNDNDAFIYKGYNSTTGTVEIINNDFYNSDGDFIQVVMENSANLNLTVGGPAGADSNLFTNTGAFTPLAGGLTFSPGGGAGWNGRLDFDINGNVISNSNTQGININLLKPATSGATIDGFIRNNTISNTNNNFGGSIQVTNGGLVSQVRVEISGNNITGDKGTSAIMVIGDQGGTVSTGARTDIRVLNNSVSAPNALNANAVHLNSSTTSANTGTIVCWDMQNNTLAGGGFSGTDTRIRQRFSSQVILPGYAGAPADVAAVQAYITARGNTGVVSAATQVPGGYSNGTCLSPTLVQMKAAYVEIARLQAAEAPAPLAPPPSIDPIAQPTADTADAPSVNVTPASDSVTFTDPETQAPEAPAATTTVGPFTLPAGEQTTITFQAIVNDPFPAANNPICNQATISGSNFSNVLSDDPAVAGSADATCTTVQINADLAITKTDGSATEVPGTSAIYTITASNAGPNPDPAAVVADTFPATITGVTWTCVGAGGGTCTASGSGNINDTVNLPVGGSITYTASGTISASATGTLVNSATVANSVGISDPTPANNSATDTDTLTPQADLSITKTDGQTSDIPGTSISYTITASNAGPSNAPSNTLADTFPAALTGVAWTCTGAGGGTCTASGSGNINDTVNLPVGASVTYTVNATISPSATGTLSNTATVTAGVTDPVAGNNSATDTTTLTPTVDLSITKTDGLTNAIPGGSVTYTIVASNAGPSATSSATVVDVFPAELTTINWTCVGAGGGTCPASGTTNLNETVNLPVGGSVTFTVVASVSSSATGSLVNTATVSSSATDSNPANNSATDTDTLNLEADLSITKTDGVASEIPGTSVTYTIVASNAGPSNIPSATVADTFPATLSGVSWTCAGAGGGICTASGSGNINEIVNLPAGGAVTFTAVGTISASATGSLANTATVSSVAFDPNAGNNSATDTDTLTPQADLAITKTDGVGTAIPGGSVTYTIVASNSGPSDVTGATVADTFPASLTATWTCVGAGGGTCTASGSGNLNDTVNLPVGASVTYTVNATISASATGTLSNTATVSSGVTDPTPGNNSATDTDTLTPQADLSITKTDGQANATPGTTIVYTIVASNAGPSNVIGATVADTFPATLTANWTCAGAGGGTCTASGSGNINDTVNLPVGGSVTYTANATISTSAFGTLSNTATVSSSVTDPTPGNNSATDTDTLIAQADLSITKTDGVTTATPGGSVTYTIVASNAGPSNVTGATVADTFPAILTATWTCVGAGGGTCTAAGAGNINDTVNLPAGGSVTYTASGTIDAGATGTLANTATVSSSVTDPNPANNSATDTDTLTPQADLAITKTDGVTTAVPGGSVTYTIVASNAGPSHVTGATVADTFPASLTATWTCVGAGGGTCTAAGSGNLNDTVNLPAGGSVTYTVNATISPSATGTLSNTATVSSGVTDPVPANNSATDTDTLTPQADVSITKTDGQTSDAPGTSITYTIVASNTGPSNAPSVTVADTFPASLLTVTWTCSGAGGGTCTAAGSGNLNDTANLPAGASVTYTVNATINAGATGTLSNTATATVGGGVTDPNPGNNSATDTTTLVAQADLAITKADSAEPVPPGSPLTYTLSITSTGPSTALNVLVTDALPAEVTWTGDTCLAGPPTGQTLVWTVGTMTSGSSLTCEVYVTVDSAGGGVITNTAVISSDVLDPNLANNTAAEPTITNVPPTLAGITVTSPINENGTATLSGTIADPDTGDTFSLVVDWGDGSAPQTFNYAAGTTAFSETHLYTDDNPTGTASDANPVNLTLSDSAGNTDTDSTSVTVNNLAPTLSNVAISTPINEAGTATLSGTITDPGPGDTFSLVVNWGDGSAPQTFTYAAGTTAFSETHLYSDDNPTGTASDNYTIGLTLTDDDTGSDTDTASLTVNNVAPALSALAATAINENGTTTLSGTITDPGTADTFSLVVDWGDGSAPQTFNYAAGTTAFNETHTYADDNPSGTFTIALTLTDDDTGSDTDSTTVSVSNTAPILSNVAISTPINEGDTATLTGNIADVGTLDTFSLTVDWGDGSTPESFTYPAGTTSFSETHVYADDNPTGTASDVVTVNLTLTDDDTGSDTDTTSLTVNNVAPTLTNITIDSGVVEGDTATLAGNITDPGLGDNFSLVVDWGDGSTPEPFAYVSGTSVFSETHVYVDDNPSGTMSDVYTVTLTLTDDDTGQDTDSTSIIIINGLGLTILSWDPDVDENAVFTVNAQINDPGIEDTFTFVTDWDDGSVVTYTFPAGTTVITVTHIYADDNPTGTPTDPYYPSYTLIDDDTSSITLQPSGVTVHNVAPSLSNLTATPVDENGTTTLSGTIADASALDSFSLNIAWGDGTVLTYTYPAGTTTFTETHPYLDDDPTGTPADAYTLTLTLTDDDTGQSTHTTTATVTNLAPALSNLALTPVNENNAATLTGVITDTGTLDSFTLFVDWGDSLTSTYTYPAGTGTFTETHTYLDGLLSPLATTYTATLTLTDDDTGQGTGSVSVMIGNTAPTITSLAATSPVNENGSTTLIGTFTDPGTQDTFTVVVDWGDGNVLTATYPAGAFDFMHTHQYLDDDPTATVSDTYSITVTLTDDDGGTDTDGVAVTINNLAPVVDAGSAQTVADTAPVMFTGVFTDAGTLDTHTYFWNFGDGDTVTGTLTPTHTFPAVGTYTVTLTVTDDDTGQGADTLIVTVVPATDLALTKQATPDPVLAGTALVYTLTVLNHGPSDATSVVVTDTLPANVTFASASAGCLETGGVVTCAIGDVANGASVSVQIIVTVALDFEGVLTNTAIVGSANADPIPGNNTANATVEAVTSLIVFEDDFEDPPINDEWGCATPVESTTPVGDRTFLGEFGADTVCLSLNNLPQHATVTVEFDLFVIRSWDGNQIDAPANLIAYTIDSTVGPDYWLLEADGTTLIATTFTNWADLQQGYPGNLSMASYSYPAWAGAEEIGTLGYEFFGLPQDAVYHLEFTFAHTGDTLDLEFISQQLQDIFDESWGLDNVVVSISMSDPFGQTYQVFLPIIAR